MCEIAKSRFYCTTLLSLIVVKKKCHQLQVNASTLLDFFNQLGKSPTETASSSGGRFNGNSLSGALDRVAVKEEPLSEEDLRALQKDRQKKDNHNMSKFFFMPGLSSVVYTIYYYVNGHLWLCFA